MERPIERRVLSSESGGDSRSIFYRIGGAAAFAAAALFLIGLLGLAAAGVRPGVYENWLVTILKLHAGFYGAAPDALYGFHFLDAALLFLVGMAVAGLYAALHRTSKVWALIALIQPFLGVAIFAVTKLAGRSAAMGAVLVISVVMLRSKVFSKAAAFAGIAAGILLLAGDISEGLVHSVSMAALTGAGYLLLAAWLIVVGIRLFRLVRPASKGAAL